MCSWQYTSLWRTSCHFCWIFLLLLLLILHTFWEFLLIDLCLHPVFFLFIFIFILLAELVMGTPAQTFATGGHYFSKRCSFHSCWSCRETVNAKIEKNSERGEEFKRWDKMRWVEIKAKTEERGGEERRGGWWQRKVEERSRDEMRWEDNYFRILKWQYWDFMNIRKLPQEKREWRKYSFSAFETRDGRQINRKPRTLMMIINKVPET